MLMYLCGLKVENLYNSHGMHADMKKYLLNITQHLYMYICVYIAILCLKMRQKQVCQQSHIAS